MGFCSSRPEVTEGLLVALIVWTLANLLWQLPLLATRLTSRINDAKFESNLRRAEAAMNSYHRMEKWRAMMRQDIDDVDNINVGYVAAEERVVMPEVRPNSNDKI